MDFEKDYYADLGVLPDVSKEVIRAVYLALAKRFHPDSGGEHADQEKFKTINAAYEILSDENARRKYDEGRTDHQQSSYNQGVDEEEDLFDDELVDDWEFAVEYYPELEEMRREVSAISSTLSVVFQSTILETKNFKAAEKVKAGIVEQFVERYFGTNTAIKRFALKLLHRKKRDAARELNKAVLVFGQSIDPYHVIPKIIQKFGFDNVTHFDGFPQTTGSSQFVLRHGELAVYSMEDGSFILVNKSLSRVPSTPVFTNLEEAKSTLMKGSGWWYDDTVD